MGEGVEALVVGNEGDTESEQSDMGNVEVGEVDTKSGKSDVGNVKGDKGGTESGKSDVGNKEGGEGDTVENQVSNIVLTRNRKNK